MLRSKAFTPGFKLFGGITVFSVVAAYLFAFGGNLANSDMGLMDAVLGPLSVGWKGGVGGHLGYSVLAGTTVGAGLWAALMLAFRDADSESQAQVSDVEPRALTAVPHGASYAPVALALGAVGLIIGLASSTVLTVVSIVVLVATAVVWTTRAWAARLSDNDAENFQKYETMMEPWRVPLVSVAAIAFVIVGLSRILLAVSKLEAVIVLAVVTTVFFIGAAVVAARPRMVRNSLAVLAIAAAVIVLAAAIYGLAVGEREFKDLSKASAPPSAHVVADTTGDPA